MTSTLKLSPSTKIFPMLCRDRERVDLLRQLAKKEHTCSHKNVHRMRVEPHGGKIGFEITMMRPSQRGNVGGGGGLFGGGNGSGRRSSFSRGGARGGSALVDERTTTTAGPSEIASKSAGGAAAAAAAAAAAFPIDEEVENESSLSMEEITNARNLESRKQHQATTTTTIATSSSGAANKMEENSTLQRSFGHEIKGHSNYGDAATKSMPSTGEEGAGSRRSHESSHRPSIHDSKRMSMLTTTATSKSHAAVAVDRRMSLSSSYRRPGNVAKPTAAAATASSLAASARPGGAPKTPFLRSHLTPVRISSKVPDADVQATNNGYASVAKLSAWLADDPTKAKQRVKQIRRGANVIAKSRKFDKELANVKIIEADTMCRRGLVREKQHWLIEQQQLAAAASADDDASISASSQRTASTTYGGLETSSAISVQDKKEWLTNAFTSSQPPKARAKTDVGSFEDEVESVTVRAKQIWRQRTSISATPPPQPPQALASYQWRPAQSTTTKGSKTESTKSDATSVARSNVDAQTFASPLASSAQAAQDAASVASMPITSVEFDSVPSSLLGGEVLGRDLDDAMSLWSQDLPATESEEKTSATRITGPPVPKETHFRSPPRSTPLKREPASTDRSEPSPAQCARLMELQKIRSSAVVRNTADMFVRKDPEPEPEPEPDENDEDKVLSFQAARDLLINRSKQNGNALEVASKVSRRKAMFEKLQKDNHRKSFSHGHLKPSWKPDEGAAVAAGKVISASKYKKTFVLDPVPKKSFEDLP
jgi:hypothetical protein